MGAIFPAGNFANKSRDPKIFGWAKNLRSRDHELWCADPSYYPQKSPQDNARRPYFQSWAPGACLANAREKFLSERPYLGPTSSTVVARTTTSAGLPFDLFESPHSTPEGPPEPWKGRKHLSRHPPEGGCIGTRRRTPSGYPLNIQSPLGRSEGCD